MEVLKKDRREKLEVSKERHFVSLRTILKEEVPPGYRFVGFTIGHLSYAWTEKGTDIMNEVVKPRPYHSMLDEWKIPQRLIGA